MDNILRKFLKEIPNILATLLTPLINSIICTDKYQQILKIQNDLPFPKPSKFHLSPHPCRLIIKLTCIDNAIEE